MKNRFPLFRPPVLKGKYLHEVLASRWLTEGPMCERLLGALEPVVGRPKEHLVLANSATVALQAILAALRESPCGKAQVTPATWAGVREVVRGHNEAARSSAGHGAKRRPCVLTQVGGSLFEEGDPEMDGHSTPIHDFSHSWEYGVWAHWGFASMYPTKLVPGAEGGVAVCPSEVEAQQVRRLLHCGLEPLHLAGSGRSVVPVARGRSPGLKGNMTDVAAALNLEALENHPRYVREIQEAWETLNEAFRMAGLWWDVYGKDAPRKYLFQVNRRRGGATIEEARHILAQKGIPSAVNFPPRERITLPLYPRMGRIAADEIAEAWGRART